MSKHLKNNKDQFKGLKDNQENFQEERDQKKPQRSQFLK